MRVLKVSVYLHTMKKIIATILSCFLSLVVLAQREDDWFSETDPNQHEEHMQSDSVKKQEYVPHFRIAWQWMHYGAYKKIVPMDTLQDGVHNYNLIFKKNISNTYLGNFPSPYESDIYIQRTENMDFYPLKTVRAYMFRPEDALEYNTTTPYTLISYFNGGSQTKSENWLDVWHIQNIRPFWSVGLRYNLVSSKGAYSFQQSKTYNFSGFSSFEKERVAVSLFVNQNMGHFEENGGVANLADIRDTILNTQMIETRLKNAPTSNYMNFNLYTLVQYNIGGGKKNKQLPPPNPLTAEEQELLLSLEELEKDEDSELTEEQSLQLTQFRETIALATPVDTVKKDSVINYPMKATAFFRMEENRRTFKESSVEAAFFPVSYINDATNMDAYANKVVEGGGKLIVNEHPRYTYLPGIHAGITYKHLSYTQQYPIEQDSVEMRTDKDNGVYLTAGIFNVDTTALFHFDASGSFCLTGDYVSDFSLQGEITQYLQRDRNSFVRASAQIESKTPNPYLDYYLGNHNYWENNFDKIKSYDIRGSYHNIRRRTELGVGLKNIKDHIYFDTQVYPGSGEDIPDTTYILPRQYKSDLLVVTAWAKQNFRLGKFFFDQTVYYQLSNKSEVLSLPMVSLYSHNYYRNTFFDNALDFQFGVDLFYTTKFYARAYDPATMQFYNQQIEKNGNYPKVDVFLAFRIKRADLFIKAEHVSLYFANKNYISALNYPLNPLKIKYGVRWNFFD